MSNIIAAYRSRTVTMQVFSELRESGVNCVLISTPREANVGCGLSIRFDEGLLNSVRSISRYPTFAGFFRISRVNEKRIVTRL